MSGHIILLANFYGSYLNQDRFKAVAIVNNAGIEQLATLGVEKVKEVKSRGSSDDEIWVLIVAGLTDVLIKSVEEGKNKLEITPNSTQLLETKMQWAHSLLSKEGAKIIWAVMPPISLRMYHISEGWNVKKIPGMSSGLDKEQGALNSLMYNYRGLCMKLNSAHGKKVIKGPFFTDMVSDLSHDRGSMNLNTGYFENDGISPTSKLVENWNSQVLKIFVVVEKRAQRLRAHTPPSLLQSASTGNSWDLPPPKGMSSERPSKRPHGDNQNFYGFQSASSSAKNSHSDVDRARPMARDVDFERYPQHSREDRSPMAKIPSLVDMAKSLDTPHRPEFSASAGDNSAKEMATAVQLLAATMQMGGGNTNNMQSMLSALVNQQQQQTEKEKRLEEERILQKRLEEERIAILKQEETRRLQRQVEEAKRQEARYREEQRRREREEEERRWEEQRRREERLMAERRQIELIRQREEDKLRELNIRKKAAEEQRLREIQIAAKIAMEQQKRKEREEQAKILREQQAQIALMAVTKQVREQLLQNSKPPQSALDRINEKLKSDREQKNASSKLDRLGKDPAWASPVVLFSFVNRSNECKPLRGISAPKVVKGSAKASDYKSRGQWVYKTPGAVSPSLNLLKIKVKKPGTLSDFETKVARFNNRVCEMVEECEQLIQEGRFCGYIIRKDSDEAKSNKEEGTFSSDKEVKLNSSASEGSRSQSTSSTDKKPSAKQRLGKPMKDKHQNSSKTRQESPKPASKVNKPAENQASRRSIEAKPRWDKSDESDDELMWDDDPVPLKMTVVDDDDVKSTKGADEGNDANEPNMEISTEVKKKDADGEVIDLDAVPTVENKAGKREVPKQATNEITKVSEENGKFITLDDTADGNAKPSNGAHADNNAENFVTIDEAM